ncbi:hypothetical protein [uncultured Oscillibacter sp.]|uniref:hypothetical protein n=1 Tax=uncultured Oscillibacter sp. TaxID=876091 RepID=UPI0025E4DF25|nr:hypothetical protein [uncultured Oscillibacter sp.]
MKDDANGSAIHLLSDIRNILLGIVLMLAGIGSILFSMAIVHDFFLCLGGVLLLCGLVKVLGLWVDSKVDAEASQNANQPESADSDTPSNKPNTQKED